jgi:hypothetical protein
LNATLKSGIDIKAIKIQVHGSQIVFAEFKLQQCKEFSFKNRDGKKINFVG